MNVAEIFIRRPVMTALVMLGILMFGIMGYRLLPVSDLPNVDFPTILVSASLPGATPDTMASAVAMPLEKQFSTIAGVDSMTSSSTQGSTQITLQFNLSRNLDAAAQDVQSMIAKAARDLPQNLPSPPSYQKVNPADQPILYLSLSSPTLRLSDVDEYAETLMAQRISMVSGVAQVSVYGAQKYAVHASGLVIFATCSLEPEECEGQVTALLRCNPDVTRVPIEADEIGGMAECISAAGDLRTLPSQLPNPEPRLSGSTASTPCACDDGPRAVLLVAPPVACITAARPCAWRRRRRSFLRTHAGLRQCSIRRLPAVADVSRKIDGGDRFAKPTF